MSELTGICINAGSGQRPFKPPFINVDAQARFNPDVLFDLRGPWPWGDETARCIVFHHCWEHDGTEDRRHFLNESFRILKRGGRLIICVPDMRALAQAWLMGKMSTELFMTNTYGAYMGSDHDRHKFGFDTQSLVDELEKGIPFTGVNQGWEYVRPMYGDAPRKIEGADIAIDWWILIVEATK
jgi:predicted SAM-dependent methyltransferase